MKPGTFEVLQEIFLELLHFFEFRRLGREGVKPELIHSSFNFIYGKERQGDDGSNKLAETFVLYVCQGHSSLLNSSPTRLGEMKEAAR